MLTPFLVSYFSDIKEGNIMFDVQHGTMLDFPCIRCLATGGEGWVL